MTEGALLQRNGTPADGELALGGSGASYRTCKSGCICGRGLPAAMAVAGRIARNGPLAVRQIKQTLAECFGRPLAEAFQLEDAARGFVMASSDAREGPAAFLERRSPVYTGF